MLPPMPQININFLGSSNFVSFGHGSTSVMHPLVAQAPTTQLSAPHTFEHVPSPLLRQCSVQEGDTRDSSTIGTSTKSKKNKKSNILPIQSSLARVTKATSRLQFGTHTDSDVNGHVGNVCIDFPTLPISHSSECANVSCPFVLTVLPQESKMPQPSSNVHSSFVVPNVDSSRVALNLVNIVRPLLQ